MRSKIVAAVLVTAVMSMGSVALAAGTTASGTIKALDAKVMTVMLQDGTIYSLPAGLKTDNFKVGDPVTLTWALKNGVKDVETIRATDTAVPVSAMVASGTIKAMDTKAMTVTLQDGTLYMLPTGFKLDGFKTGEKVTLTWAMKDGVKDIETMKAA